MANLKKQTGIRISQYQVAQINDNDKKNKLLLNHNFITYAPSYFGTSTMNKNYQIPVQTLRDDFRGYLGIENAKGTWQNTIRIWSGNWIDTENRENSYVYQWKYDERGNLDYIADKWGDEEDVDKIFLLRNAPIPFEEPQQDPNPKSNKFVDKKYIDDRFNGIRKVKTSNTTLQIRPYPCVYEYSTMPSSINIVDTLTLEDGRKIKDCIEKNCLIFYIKLPTPTSTTLSVKANNVDTKWGFSGELTQLLSTAKKNADSGLIKCYAEYINGTFTVHCTNGMNLKPVEGGTVEIDTTDTIVDGSDAVPTSNAVYDHVKSHEDKNIHITSSERTSWNNKISEIVNGNFINVTNKNTVSVKTSTTISDDATTVPTTKAVHVDTNITKYYFPDLEYEDRKDYMILDYTGSPTYVSFADEIVNGYSMFRGWGMNKFIANFPNLTSGEEMFMNCPYLYYIDSDFSKVTNGYRMFRRSLVQFGGSAGSDYVQIYVENQPIMYFKSSLRSLTDGTGMFEGCKLGKQAVLNIVNTLKTENECNTDANITLGIVKTLENDQEILTALGITAGATSAQITNKMGNKWNVTIQWINLSK